MVSRALSAISAISAIAVLLAAPVRAADLGGSLKDPPIDPPAPPISWTGCYAGTDGGYKWSRNRVTTPATYNLDNPGAFGSRAGGGVVAARELVNVRGISTTTDGGGRTTVGNDGGFWGGQAGCNYDTRTGVVVGLEISGTWDFAKETYTEEVLTADVRRLSVTNLTTEIERQCQFRVGPRIGTTLPGLGTNLDGLAPLVYVTGGYAATCYKIKQTSDHVAFRNAVANPDTSDSRFESGWFAGVGIDIPTSFLMANTFVQIEYSYADYGSTTIGIAGSNATRTFDATSNEVRVGFKYRFQ
jgi:opacity protein-like surface antigen